MKETVEEIYSRSIIKNILDELSDDITPKEVYGICELYLQAELDVYKKAFPNINHEIVEDIVREYLFYHNYLRFSALIEGKAEYSYDPSEMGAIYIKCSDDLSDEYEVSINISDDVIVDVDKNGLVKGVEILGANEFLGLGDDESVESYVVGVNIGIDVVRINVSFNINGGDGTGRVKQWDGIFLGENFIDSSVVGLYCVYSD